MIKVNRQITFLVISIAALALNVQSGYGQWSSLCSKFGLVIKTVLKKPQVFRNESTSYGCILEFDRPDLRADLHWFNAESDSKKAVRSQVYAFRFDETQDGSHEVEETLETNSIWNEAFMFAGHGPESSKILLRHDTKVFSAISPDKKLLADVERALRFWISKDRLP